MKKATVLAIGLSLSISSIALCVNAKGKTNLAIDTNDRYIYSSRDNNFEHEKEKLTEEKNYSLNEQDKREILANLYSISLMEQNIKYYTEKDAIDLVSSKEGYDISTLTVGNMNENAYLVNCFETDNKDKLENLILVVNGEIVDKKFNEDGSQSVSFVENFMKYQSTSPIEDQLSKMIKENANINDEDAMHYAALLVKHTYDIPATEYSLEKLNDGAYLVKCYAYEEKEGLINEYIVVDGRIEEERFSEGESESESFNKLLSSVGKRQ